LEELFLDEFAQDDVFASDFANIMKMVPEMHRPFDRQAKVKRTGINNTLILTSFDIHHSFVPKVLPESYKRLASQIIIPKTKLVRAKVLAKDLAVEVEAEKDKPELDFFTDFEILLERQKLLESEMVGILGNIHQDTRTRDIARYPKDDLLRVAWNCFQHLRLVQVYIIKPEKSDTIYNMFSKFKNNCRK
jgi:hypothetical protein